MRQMIPRLRLPEQGGEELRENPTPDKRGHHNLLTQVTQPPQAVSMPVGMPLSKSGAVTPASKLQGPGAIARLPS